VDAEPRQRLCARLDAPLPRQLAVGAGTALFVCGTCFHPDLKIRSLSIAVDGEEQPVAAHSMPRLDHFRSLHPSLDPYDTAGLHGDPASPEDPYLHGYRSGFWGLARIRPAARSSCELTLCAQLVDGSEAAVPLQTIALGELPAAPSLDSPRPQDGPLVAICMATYRPPMDLFRRQVESIRGQTHRNWVCLVSDDSSDPEHFAQLELELAGDPRFVASRSAQRLGFYRNFERALAMTPAAAEYVALSDQDDRWYPDKLATLFDRLEDAQLVYSDARVIDRAGGVISETYWSRRRNNHGSLLSLLVANSITGAASLFRRELLDYALPFPPAQFAHFHDHWIGLVALTRGEIQFVDRPLYDYVQHRDAALGHAQANRMVTFRARLGSLKADPRERIRMWRLHYFVDAARLTQCATILTMRCERRMAAGKRSALERFVRADTSLIALGDLWRRGACELIGTPETLGAEWMLAYAFTWRRLLGLSVRDRPLRGLRLDAVPPPDLVIGPGQRAPENPVVRAIAEKIAPLELMISDAAPRRVNLLIPTIDLGHFFGGYIGKLNLARRLAERGLRVRLVTVDPVGPLPRDWRREVQRYGGLAGLFESVELAFGRESSPLEVSRDDRFIATTWWTAHIAHEALASLHREGFLYLIQEYEPFTFPMGTYAALASGSYEFPHRALFSTELLREYFRAHAIGVYAFGAASGDSGSASFQNAITTVAPPSARELRERGTRRLLFYARPEAHASRNMFELGLLALQRAAGEGAFGAGWELRGIGTVAGARTLSLGGDFELELIPRAEQGAYAELLPEHDVGLALMYTPHPSLVPIEMASAGMLTVSNRFENKTEEAMKAISSNLLAPAPAVGAVAAALRAAAGRVDDHDARVCGSAVNWSRDWNDSLADHLLDRVISMLAG